MDATPSPALLDANRRLYELRARQPRYPGTAEAPYPFGKETAEGSVSIAQSLACLPLHLGWGSEAATRAVRAALKRHPAEPGTKELASVPFQADNQSNETTHHRLPDPTDPVKRQQSDNETVKHYPTLGIAALKAGEAPVYQVWLACRFLDENGRGWLSLQEVRQQLTGPGCTGVRLFGWRRLRQVLGQGNGRYWMWDKVGSRLWLFGAARVAAELNVERLSGRPVALPLKVVASSSSTFKAHLYAAWHSGRKHNNPISRQVQQQLTGLPERTQRHYCRRAGVKRQQNITIGGNYSSEAAQECAWRRGRAMFEFYDANGQHGQLGGHYLAWQLPTTHVGPHQQASKGRQRKVNHKLQDLVINRARGNSSEKVGRCYWPDEAAAAKSYNRNPKADAHWPQPEHEDRRYQLWRYLLT